MSATALTIVAVHGNGGGASRYARVQPYVPDDVRFVAVTLPGFSTSPKDPNLRTLADYADRLAEEVATAGERPVLLGHGIGGSISLDLVARRPELVSGLILHAPVGSNLDTRLIPRLMGTEIVRTMAKKAIGGRALRPLLRRLYFPHGAPRDDLDGFFDEYRHCEAFSQMFELITPEWFDALEPVTDVPVIVLWGSGDRILRSGQAEAIKVKAPGAEIEVREGWDHFPMIEQPEEYASEIVALAVRLNTDDA